MNFTFAITTTFENEKQLQEVYDSIRALEIPEYEILVIGGEKREDEKDVTYLYFDEIQKPGWVTRKKNCLIQAAKYDNIVLMHDYYVFDKDWYKNFLTFGDDWDVCSCQQLLITGERHFTDWVVWDDFAYMNHAGNTALVRRYTALHYDNWSDTKYMYQSGGFMILKRKVGLDIPFNEGLMHSQSEDVEWSLRMRDKCKWVCNGKSIVRHNKRHRDAK